mmetsp:Transcript_116910/g.363932  ORF Transcript_116910/g.363932 Transcript_116910/m.363932 type:complete len:221 (-) Transcript_116910:555-1217(-)
MPMVTLAEELRGNLHSVEPALSMAEQPRSAVRVTLWPSELSRPSTWSLKTIVLIFFPLPAALLALRSRLAATAGLEASLNRAGAISLMDLASWSGSEGGGCGAAARSSAGEALPGTIWFSIIALNLRLPSLPRISREVMMSPASCQAARGAGGRAKVMFARSRSVTGDCSSWLQRVALVMKVGWVTSNVKFPSFATVEAVHVPVQRSHEAPMAVDSPLKT